MTHFEDGPAKGQTLMLKRAPLFLRVVEADGQWDALDQPDDQPLPKEKAYAYERIGTPGMVHLNTGHRNHGGFFTMATYRFFQQQPSDADMRYKERWDRWRREADRPSPPDPVGTGRQVEGVNKETKI